MTRHGRSLVLSLLLLAAVFAGALLWWRAPGVTPPSLSAIAPAVAVRVPLFSEGVGALTLIAGDGTAGFVDGPALGAHFADPWGVAIAADGRILVADAGDTNRIRWIDPTGRVGGFAGSSEGFADGTREQAKFDTPSGLATDAHGNVYVADTGNDAIRRIAPDGTVTTVAGGAGPGDRDGPVAQARFNGPIGVAVDAQGNLYVADTYNHRIRRIGTDGIVVTVAGSLPGLADGHGAQARFDTPCGVTVGPDGTLWVADTRNRAIRRVTPEGDVTTFAVTDNKDLKAPLRRPLAILADTDALYVAEASHGTVLRYGYDGALRQLTGDDERPDGLTRPAGLAIDAKGLIVTDATAARVHRVVPRGMAGAAQPSGPALDAPLPETHGRWPIAPQDAWHEIVGTLGEVRGNDEGDSRDHLHAGLDVRGDVGAEVHAIADGKVSDPLAAWGFGKLSEGLAIDTLDYIHMRVGRNARGVPLDPKRFAILPGDDGKSERVQVRRGTRFHAGDVLGTVNAMAHTHLSLDGNASGRNAIDLGFTAFADHVAPTIEGVELRDATDQPLKTKRGGRLVVPRTAGGVRIVVDAWDQVDDNLPRRRLGLYALGYQLLKADGTPMPDFASPRMNLVFDRIPMDDAATKIIYAPDSGETVHGSARTRFLYVVTNILRDGVATEGSWDVASLAPGDYLLRIVASDSAGNVAIRRRDVPIVVP